MASSRATILTKYIMMQHWESKRSVRLHCEDDQGQTRTGNANFGPRLQTKPKKNKDSVIITVSVLSHERKQQHVRAECTLKAVDQVAP